MTFIFQYSDTLERNELMRILAVEGDRHFGLKQTPLNSDEGNWKMFDQCNGLVKFIVKDKSFIEDLQKSKNAVYNQNGSNRKWHDLKEDPSDLPIDSSEKLVKIYDSIETDTYNPEEQLWKNCLKEHVIAWKDIEADEVLLYDFLSEIEENLSFVSKMEVE